MAFRVRPCYTARALLGRTRFSQVDLVLETTINLFVLTLLGDLESHESTTNSLLHLTWSLFGETSQFAGETESNKFPVLLLFAFVTAMV